jgi:hypothetical protein
VLRRLPALGVFEDNVIFILIHSYSF